MSVTGVQNTNSFVTWNHEENYITKTQKLAAEIQHLLNDSTQEKTHNSELDKKEYKQINATAAGYHTSIGRANVVTAMAELLAVGICAMKMDSPAMQAAGAKIVSAIGSTWPSEYQREQAIANSNAQLLYTKIQNGSSQQQNEAMKQEILNALNKLLETLSASTR